MTRLNCTSYMSNIHQFNFEVVLQCWIFLIVFTRSMRKFTKKCRVCSTSVAPPPRAKISGIRASVFGDIIFLIIVKSTWRRRSMSYFLLWTVQRTYFGLRPRIHSIRKRHWYIFENGMNKTMAFQRPLLDMKPSSQMSWKNITSSMESRTYLVDQGHHGQTELKQQWDCSRDNGHLWPNHWKEMKGLMVLA